MGAIFAYGALQIPEVMLAVTGSRFSGQPARLRNFVRKKLRGESFPGMCPENGSVVFGICYRGIDAHALRKLDVFESDYYRRERQTIIFLSGAEGEAETYVLREEFYGLLLDENWHLEDFRRRHLPNFLANHF